MPSACATARATHPPVHGFQEQPLRLNAGLRETERWDETAIRARAARLADLAVEIWRRPVLTDRVLASYETPRAGTGGYTIEHHPHLRPGAPMHDPDQYAMSSWMGRPSTPSRRLRFSSKLVTATTTPSAHMAAWDTGRRPQKRSSRQAGHPAPLRSAGHPAWRRNRQCPNMRTGPPVGGRSTCDDA